MHINIHNNNTYHTITKKIRRQRQQQQGHRYINYVIISILQIHYYLYSIIIIIVLSSLFMIDAFHWMNSYSTNHYQTSYPYRRNHHHHHHHPHHHWIHNNRQQQQQLDIILSSNEIFPSYKTKNTIRMSSLRTTSKTESSASSPSIPDESNENSNNNNNNNYDNNRSSQSLSTTLGGKLLRQLVIQAARFDRSKSLDIKGIMWMEHINIVVGDNKDIAEYFYSNFLGCTRDIASPKSFHMNLGQQQFHLATETPDNPTQVLYGSIGIVVPSLISLRQRIPNALSKLQNITKFHIIKDTETFISLQCPWGNIFHIYSVENDNNYNHDDDDSYDSHDSHELNKADTTHNNNNNHNDDLISSTLLSKKMVAVHVNGNKSQYGTHRMAIRGGYPGIRYMECICPIGTIDSIIQFYKIIFGYEHIMKQSIHIPKDNNNNPMSSTTPPAMTNIAVVSVGNGLHIVFVEDWNNDNNQQQLRNNSIQLMKGTHICIYVNDFENIYNKLYKYNLIWTNPRFIHLDTCNTYEEAKLSRTLRFRYIMNHLNNNDAAIISDNNAPQETITDSVIILELEHETRSITHGQYYKILNYDPK